MKLKEDFITHSSVDGVLLLATGEEAKSFHGLVKLNETAAKIVELLKEETSKEEILAKFKEEYPSVDEDILSKDIDNVLAQLESIHAII